MDLLTSISISVSIWVVAYRLMIDRPFRIDVKPHMKFAVGYNRDQQVVGLNLDDVVAFCSIPKEGIRVWLRNSEVKELTLHGPIASEFLRKVYQ